MAKLKIEGNGSGTGTFTIISPNSDTDATIELPHSSGTLITSSQSIVPSQDNIFDLGRSDKVFRDIWVSGSTINLGNQTIKASATGIVVPELTIGTGTNTVKLKASSDGKLKQTSTDVSGIETPEIDIPNLLGEMEDVDLTTSPTANQVLRWNNTSSKWKASTDPISVFSDFTDVDTVTTPPTDTQVLTWNDTNNNWQASINSLPYNVSNTTELLALTGMEIGQEAIVTDLNRNYVYTGSAPNDNWRHAVSGWYAVEDILTNHPTTGITGINSTYSLTVAAPTQTITCVTDDPDEKPMTFAVTTEADLTGIDWWGGNFASIATVEQPQDGAVFIFTQKEISGGVSIPVNFTATFSAFDDSITPTTFQAVFSAFAVQIQPSWDISGEFESEVNLEPPDDDLSFGRSVALDAIGNTLIVSNSIKNKVHVYDKNVAGGWIKNTSLLPSTTTIVGTYGGEERERYSYGTNQIAISSEGNTIAVGCLGGQGGNGDVYDPPNNSGTPYVEVFYKNDTTSIWESSGICNPTPYSVGGVKVAPAGMSVALSDDGKILVVGYRLEGPAQPSGTSHNTYADGTRTSLSNPTSDRHYYNEGAVYIYELGADLTLPETWIQTAKFTSLDSAASLGASVDVSQPTSGILAGKTIVIASAPNASTMGSTGGDVGVYIKTSLGGNHVWQREHIIRPAVVDQLSNNRFGFNSISISKDGHTIAVGDIGQAVTSVVGNTITGEVSSFTKFTGSNTYPAGVVYIYRLGGNGPDSFYYGMEVAGGGIIENFIGNDGDGFGDTVQLNHTGTLVSIGAPYEHNGFYFPGQQVGSSYIHDYTAKRVFYGWYRFSHYGTLTTNNQPASAGELDAWNYTEATQAINCTVNSSTYIGFVTPPDGKTSTFDLSVSFTSKNTWDNDMISIVIAFNTDANGKEHTISLIRSGGGIEYVYAIVYNYAQPDKQVIFDGASLITDTAFAWGSTVASTGEGQFVRNRIVRSGDTFTVTTSQLLHPNSHNGTNSQLDSSTTHTFSLSSYSFGSLFSAANGGARWGFACHSQDLSSWVNVDLLDSINPEEIPDVGSVHIFERNDSTSTWDKSKRFYPSTFVRADGQKLTDTHMGRASFSADGKLLASGRKGDNSNMNGSIDTEGTVEVWDAN